MAFAPGHQAFARASPTAISGSTRRTAHQRTLSCSGPRSTRVHPDPVFSSTCARHPSPGKSPQTPYAPAFELSRMLARTRCRPYPRPPQLNRPGGRDCGTHPHRGPHGPATAGAPPDRPACFAIERARHGHRHTLHLKFNGGGPQAGSRGARPGQIGRQRWRAALAVTYPTDRQPLAGRARRPWSRTAHGHC